MARNNDVAAAAVCGGATCCILICLFVIGIPTLIAGIVLVAEFDETEARCTPPGRQTPRSRQTPPWQADTPQAYTPGADNPLDRHPLGRYPPGETPPRDGYCSGREFGEGPHTAGIVCIVIACVLIVAGVITAIFTCVFVGRAAEHPRVQNQTQFVSTQGTNTTGYPIVPPQQGQGYPQGQVQGQEYYPTKGQGEYPQVHVQSGHPTAAQYGGNQNPSYAKY